MNGHRIHYYIPGIAQNFIFKAKNRSEFAYLILSSYVSPSFMFNLLNLFIKNDCRLDQILIAPPLQISEGNFMENRRFPLDLCTPPIGLGYWGMSDATASG